MSAVDGAHDVPERADDGRDRGRRHGAVRLDDPLQVALPAAGRRGPVQR